ncbi:gamma-glutamyltranspeptidase [Zychaea mexicana]|uniref:gamma-glutamyltranspeptidase n=1 Tax=Zychaea mexicana TaxID=64656 RepID=UPI0022FE79DE|nr:gamma-glutamyltranspeptidase [Zychaea mexicana]KAI9494949.1 gamma-glutamyltranspeptidase [Zychaea mexicana]
MTLDTLPFISRRSAVYGTHGMVASSQPLATQAGVDILKKGGNAADAAVAVAAALNVTEPASTGIGGDAFCLFYDAKTRKVRGLNGSGRTPAALTIEYLREKASLHGSSLPNYSVHAVTVPGAAAAWVDTVEHFGSGKVDMATVLQPAIDLAENGFPVSHISARSWKEEEKTLKELNTTKDNMLIDGVRAPAEGDIMQLTNLAETYKAVAAQGKDAFYKGRIADAIVDAVKSRGGLMTHEDLASHTSEFVDPISIDYHDWTVWEIPPNGQGITALIALGIIRALEEQHGLNLAKLEHNSAEYLHIIIEALRLAFADTRYYVTDPQVLPVPTEKLLSKEYLSERAKSVDLKKRNDKVEKGYPDETSNTVYFSVVDGEGNACSFINSNFMHFGSHIVPDNCGFTLHNRGCNFVLIEGHPNCINPKKRPYHTIIPSMITRKTPSGDHDLEACFGVMGAFMQPQGHVQVVMNLLHYLANPQHALDLPRICIAPPKPDGLLAANAYSFTDVSSSVVYVEDGIAPEEVEKLEAMGHTCYTVRDQGRSMFGRGQIIRAKKDAHTGKLVLGAGSDPRGDGHAAGW